MSEDYDKDLEKFKQSIKHPHFKYAVIDLDEERVIYKWKKPWQWFSGKRIVYVKLKPIVTKGLPTYERKRTRKN